MAFSRSRGVRIGLIGLAVLVAGGAAAALTIYLVLIRDLPDFRSLDDYRPPVVTEVFDRHGRLIGEFYRQKRRLVPIDQIPRHVQLAFVAAEDGSFFEHQGIDLSAILRAALTNLRAGRTTQGASTITQQMVKSLLLTPERTYRRKMREIILSRQIEQQFTKEEILFLYLNQIYFGSGAWGVGQAARTYFGKDAQELDVSEAALLAGLVQRPSAYDPTRNPKSAEARRLYVLRRMLADGYIDRDRFDAAIADPPVIQSHAAGEDIAIASHFTEEVRRFLFDRFSADQILNEGLRVDTTLDVDLQRAARDAIQQGLVAHDHRRGYRGPIRREGEAGVDAALAPLAETNRSQFALVPRPSGGLDGTPNAVATTDNDVTANAVAITEAQAVAGAKTAPPTEPSTQESLSQAFAYALPAATPLEGVVVSIDAETQTARIGFGAGVEGIARLEDIAWARVPDLKVRPRPVRDITQIFSVGDVARFIRIPDEAEATEDEAVEPPRELARLDLWQEPLAEGALLSLDNATGDVMAMIGGYDFERSEFNRAVQAARQPGSAFKPFIYGAALTRGFTPVSQVVDRPVVYTDPVSGFVWAPRNYGRKFYGPMTMRDALKRSINNATVHLFRDLGVRYVIDYARRFGIQAPLSADLSLALGSSSMTLLELTRAYAVYPRGGRRVVPRFIREVRDQAGTPLLGDVPLGEIPPPVLKPLSGPDEPIAESYPDSEILPTAQVITPADAYLMSDLLRTVVQEGTGRRLRSLGRTLAGKTGTTNDFTDAWFMGFSPELTTGVWVGHDDNQALGWGESGGKTALPIWGDFMRIALAPYPQRDFEVPEHIEFQRIDRASGLLAEANTQDAYFQPFLEGTAPERSYTEQTTTRRARQAARDDIF